MTTDFRELNADELDSVTGGTSLQWVALNPQPLPPKVFDTVGRAQFGLHVVQPLPPNPC